MLVALFRAEMAETEGFSAPDGPSAVAQSARDAPALPSAGSHSVLQERLSLTALDTGEGVVQPFPRSPKLQKKVASAGQPSQVKTSGSQMSDVFEKTKNCSVLCVNAGRRWGGGGSFMPVHLRL